MPCDYRAAVRILLYPWLFSCIPPRKFGDTNGAFPRIVFAGSSLALVVNIQYHSNRRTKEMVLAYYNALAAGDAAVEVAV